MRVRRMQLYQTLPLLTINGFDSLDLSGYLALSGNPAFFNNTRPFSRLHLADTAAAAIINGQVFGFRPWQRNGITFTGNGDHGYFGQEHNGRDTSDMVLMWSNDFGSGQFSPDHLSIRFMSNDLGAATGASSMRGLEAMRFFPFDRTRVNVGIGDFIGGNILDPNITEPTEVLDVLTGRVRIRQLPTELEMDSSWQVVVVNDDGVLGWRDPGSVPTGDCDWVVGEDPDEPHLATAYNGSDCNWDQRHGVAIGQDEPKHKLSVYHTDMDLLEPVAIHGDARFFPDNMEEVVGVFGMARSTTSELANMWGIGVKGMAHTARISIGVQGTGSIGPFDEGVANIVCGVMGIASAAVPGSATYAIGVYGTASGGEDNYAGYFDGDVLVNGSGTVSGTWTVSDANLKTDVNAIEGATETLGQLSAKRYRFLQDAYPSISLPQGEQFGFLAQEVEEVLPDLVRPTRIPAVFDTLGQVVHEAVDLKTVNYVAMIPLLVAGMQEQQQTIAELTSRLAIIQEDLVSCCARHNSEGGATEDHTYEKGLLTDPASDRLLSIAPNPFTDRTNINYTLERGGRTMLLVNSSDGKQLQVLHEEVKQAGEYQQVWQTSHLAPGMYYVTLLLDGEPLVKRAVKVQ